MPRIIIELPYTPEGEQAAAVLAEMAQRAGGQVMGEEAEEMTEMVKGERQSKMGARANRPAALSQPAAPMPQAPVRR